MKIKNIKDFEADDIIVNGYKFLNNEFNKLLITGLLGSGKTTLGKKFSEKLNIPLYDTDEVFEDYFEKEFNIEPKDWDADDITGEDVEKERKRRIDLLLNKNKKCIISGYHFITYYKELDIMNNYSIIILNLSFDKSMERANKRDFVNYKDRAKDDTIKRNKELNGELNKKYKVLKKEILDNKKIDIDYLKNFMKENINTEETVFNYKYSLFLESSLDIDDIILEYKNIVIKEINNELKNYIYKIIVPIYSKFDSGHNEEHAHEVIDGALLIAKNMNVNINIVFAAAAYHDVGLLKDRLMHHEHSMNYVLNDKNLKRFFNNDEINIIAKACFDHRDSHDYELDNDYSKIIYDADKVHNSDIERMIKRAWGYNNAHFSDYNSYNNYYQIYYHLKYKYGRENLLKKFYLKQSRSVAKMYADKTMLNINNEPIFKKTFLSMVNKSKIFLKDDSIYNPKYAPPYPLDKLSLKTRSCPIHVWRAKTGIELIHQEPNSQKTIDIHHMPWDEQIRIWYNWVLMTDDMKKLSDQKSLELFGMTNEQHFKYIMKKEYGFES